MTASRQSVFELRGLRKTYGEGTAAVHARRSRPRRPPRQTDAGPAVRCWLPGSMVYRTLFL